MATLIKIFGNPQFENFCINGLISLSVVSFSSAHNTVKPVYNDHPWDPEFMAIVDRWSLFRGTLIL
jgi:hypothetical protein